MIPSQKAKASTSINASVEFTRTYSGEKYKFSPRYASGLPDPYYFDSDVIDYVIEGAGKGFNFNLCSNTGIRIFDWIVSTTESMASAMYSLITNAFIATNKTIDSYLIETTIYGWYYDFTGIDSQYPGWETYGDAYGFRFIGALGDTMDLVLDSQGNFYGHNPIGNYTFTEDPEPYQWIGIHQENPDPNDPTVIIPYGSYQSFSDLKSPYIEGKSLHFFLYMDGIEHHISYPDFTHSVLCLSYYAPGGNQISVPILAILDGKNPNSISYKFYDHTTESQLNWNTNGDWRRFTYKNTEYTCYFAGVFLNQLGYSSFSCAYPFNLSSNTNNWGNITLSDCIGINNNVTVSGSNNVFWLDTFSYTPIVNPPEIPDNPVPVTSIPDDPEDPIPDSDPDPVPGISYPVNPSPNPLPPFATIVSGNDDLWGVTLDFEGAQDGLLPYMNSLSEFQFPSFSDLISDFSGSIIWVAQLMSILYNGTPLNVLFIALCLFSLVSVLIGAYKLWNSTEPDPGNPGMRRYKRPPKGGKKH